MGSHAAGLCDDRCNAGETDLTKVKTDEAAFERIQNRFSKSDIARALGITRQAVNKWGNAVPELRILAISILTDLTPDEVAPETMRRLRQEIRPKKLQRRQWEKAWDHVGRFW